MRSVLLFIAALALVGCDLGPPDEPPAEGEGEGEGEDTRDISEKLKDLVVDVTELQSQNPGARAFELFFEVPEDHDNVASPTFFMRAVLLHRDEHAPMVLNPTGYALFEDYVQLPDEITTLLQANQLAIEHRYFGVSVPDDENYEFFNLRQQAFDEHVITELMKQIYDAAWLETGHSKGGMTSVYHARFFPDDLDGVVAYVAPISFAVNDTRSRPALETLGDPTCRDDIRLAQTHAAAQLDEIVDILAPGSSRPRGEVERCVATLIADFEWGFWQYLGDCQYAPSAHTTAEETINSLWIFGCDYEFTTDAAPYEYQALSELGAPNQFSAHLDDDFAAVGYLPIIDFYSGTPWAESPTHDDGAAMEDIQDFVATQGERILFIYGEWDPWSQSPFELGTATDSFRLTAPTRNHAALIVDLAEADKAVALDALERWTGIPVDAQLTGASFSRLRSRIEDERAWLASRVGLRP